MGDFLEGLWNMLKVWTQICERIKKRYSFPNMLLESSKLASYSTSTLEFP